MDNPKQQLIERLKSANNVLVTVARNPSVDALSALLGLTLVLNKQGKHTAAVFSGQIPSTIEFLQPEETIERNTDSLRDFIIALDKSKADKLRYKVEDNVVRIFITPYKTSISEKDLEFSEGDFNIDVVVALGVQKQEDIDEAITAHGRILHDATVASINLTSEGGVGSINWHAPQASSLSELVTELTQQLGSDLIDAQIATALLTGIVAETDRFSNDKTNSVTMSVSATLMKAGANPQLVASKLNEPVEEVSLVPDSEPTSGETEEPVGDDGTIRIDHEEKQPEAIEEVSAEENETLEPEKKPSETKPRKGTLLPPSPKEEQPRPIDATTMLSPGPKLMTEPPTMGGTLTANTEEKDIEPVTDPLSLPENEADQVLNRTPTEVKLPNLTPLPLTSPPKLNSPPSSSPPAVPSPTSPTVVPSNFTPPPPGWTPPVAPAAISVPPANHIKPEPTETLSDIEKAVASPHASTSNVEAARQEVKQAYNETPVNENEPLPPIDALNAKPLGEELHSEGDTTPQPPPPVPPPIIPSQFGSSPPAAP
jgi:hypothetical protein